MTPERYARVDELFHAALARPAEQRAAFLVAACAGDAELLADVRSLIAASEAAGTFIQPRAIGDAPALLSSDQPIPTGTWIGPYEVQAVLGRGGMGEVYRAHDARVGRDVALKVLPSRLALDDSRLARFEREARTLATLTHANIAALYGIEQSEGRPVLVLELAEGPTLEERLASGPLPLREALGIAEQIADALDAAHERGIVHRDLKPANIIVTPDGVVKVLDFGLAKALAPATSEDLPAVSAQLTAERTVMGTTPYASPEQARGAKVDQRTDIWAFGCVLYEMLAGRRAFAGDTHSAVLLQVFEHAPDWNALPPDVPPSIRRLLQRCLDRNERNRLRHIGDARLDVRDALGATGDTVAVGVPSASRRRPVSRIGMAFGGALLAVLAGWLIGSRSTVTPPAAVVRLSVPGLEAPFPAPFGEHHLAISPDGSRLAYASASRLWIRPMDGRETLAIAVGASNPFFSADGEWVGFFLRGGDLQKVSVHGGAPIKITSITGRPNGATWRADGTIAFTTSEGLYLVPADGGTPQLLLSPVTARRERAFASPQFLPDGQALLFTIVPEGSIDGVQIASVELKTRTHRVIVRGGSAGRYAATGHLVYASGRRLKAVEFDAEARQTRGHAVTLPDIEVATSADNGVAEFALSHTGTAVFIAPAARRAQVTLSWIDRTGREQPLPLAPGPFLFPRVSPDGAQIAIDVPGANRDIWLWMATRPTLSRLTRGPAEDMLPTWSRDGRLFFASQQGGNFDIYSQAADGATPAQAEFAASGDQMPNGFTPDGRQLIVNENFKDLSVLTLTRPARLDRLLHSDANEWLGEVSPDGKWIAYESDEAGDQFEIFLRPFPDVTTRREKISIDGGRYPKWAPDGSGELFYVSLNGAMMSAGVTLSPALALGPVTKLFDVSSPPSVITARPYDVSPRDGRFLIGRPAVAGRIEDTTVNVILNWTNELRQVTSRMR